MSSSAFLGKLSLQAKVMAIILGAITVILGASGAYHYSEQEHHTRTELEELSHNVAERLAQNLKTPLWDMDDAVAHDVILSEMAEKDVYAILAFDESGKNVFAGMSRDSEWKAVRTAKDVAVENYVTSANDIVYNDKTIGHVSVLISKEFMRQELEQTFISIIVETLLIGFVVVGLLFVVLRYYLIIPLGLMREFASRVAEGDLEYRLDKGNFTAELLELKQSVESMVDSLAENLQAVRVKHEEAEAMSTKAGEAAREAEQARLEAERARREGLSQAADNLEEIVAKVTQSSGELANQVEGVSQGAQQQADQVRETATAMEEMNATVLEVAKNASAAAEMGEAAKIRAEEGSQLVLKSMERILSIKAMSEELKTDMNELGGQAENIGQVMNVIADIADQTNLLALNAAIEAARAGDAGRGFAVVADEVRKLAEKTMTATHDVAKAIKAIQASAQKSIEGTEQTVHAIDENNELAQTSSEQLKQIVTDIEATAEQIRSIATAAEQQSATSEEINQRIDDINRITQQTTHGMETSAGAVGELASLANGIKRLVDELKHEGNA